MDPIECFRFVRDIPYHIPLHRGEPDHCCNGKHVILKTLLEHNGYAVRPRVCLYSWADLPLPGELEIPPDADCMHLYLEARKKRGRKWYVVDATWDKGLASVLPVNEWDGKSHTRIGVYSIEAYSVEESLELFLADDSEYDGDKEALARFYIGFNKWLESIRKGF